MNVDTISFFIFMASNCFSTDMGNIKAWI
jgi:hypothetical protein